MVLRITALALILSGLGLADPIIFTIQGSGTGTVDTTAFSDVPFAFTLTTDTTLITSETLGGGEVVFETPGVSGVGISINGVGSGTFTDLESVFDSNNTAGITVSSGSLTGTDLLDGSNDSFLTYNLQSSIGPLSMDSIALDFVNIPTSLGSVTFTLATGVLFTAATTIGVPEPGTFMLGAAGALLLAGVRLLARAR